MRKLPLNPIARPHDASAMNEPQVGRLALEFFSLARALVRQLSRGQLNEMREWTRNTHDEKQPQTGPCSHFVAVALSRPPGRLMQMGHFERLLRSAAHPLDLRLALRTSRSASAAAGQACRRLIHEKHFNPVSPCNAHFAPNEP